MDSLKDGGKNASDSVLTASQLQRQDILARYEHMRKSVRALKESEARGENAEPFIVRLKSSTVPVGTPRTLTAVEAEELRDTKRQIAEYMERILGARLRTAD